MFKCVEELQHEINKLKQQLSSVTDENQMLKVKFRKLQNDAQKKDKHIEYLMNPIKNLEMRKLVNENGIAIILNLQKRNKELEKIIAEKDARNRKHENYARTARLYSHRAQDEECRKKAQAISSLGSRSPLSSHLSNAENLLVSGSNRTSFQAKWSNSTKSPTVKNVIGNTHSFGNLLPKSQAEVLYLGKQHPERLSEIIRKLKETVLGLRKEQLEAEKIIQLKNSELENLSNELKRIESQLIAQSRNTENNDGRSNSTGRIPAESSKSLSGSLLSLKSSYSHRITRQGKEQVRRRYMDPCLPYERQSLSCNRVLREVEVKLNRKKSANMIPKIHETRQAFETENLEVVVEKNEDMIADIPANKLQCMKNTLEYLVPKTSCETRQKHKTEIQYSIDSEVSSDGEEMYVATN